jgi:hypothetical protein
LFSHLFFRKLLGKRSIDWFPQRFAGGESLLWDFSFRLALL